MVAAACNNGEADCCTALEEMKIFPNALTGEAREHPTTQQIILLAYCFWDTQQQQQQQRQSFLSKMVGLYTCIPFRNGMPKTFQNLYANRNNKKEALKRQRRKKTVSCSNSDHC